MNEHEDGATSRKRRSPCTHQRYRTRLSLDRAARKYYNSYLEARRSETVHVSALEGTDIDAGCLSRVGDSRSMCRSENDTSYSVSRFPE